MKSVILHSSLVVLCGCSSVLGIGGYGVGDALNDGEISDGNVDAAEDGSTESGVDAADTRDTRLADAVVDAPEAATDSAKDTAPDTRDVYCSSVTFGAMSVFSTSINGGPNFVALADLEQSGFPDLLEANTYDYLGKGYNPGSGTFATESTFSTGSGSTPNYIATGDFNGDGYPDVAVANPGTNNVSVFINNGSGNFGPALNYAAGTGPTSVATADFNGDGILDLIVTNPQSNTVTLLLGNVAGVGGGRGSFGSQTTITTGTNSFPTNVVVGHFAGHALPDIAFVEENPTRLVGVMFNIGGSFESPSVFAPPGAPDSIAVADYDNDGKPDMIVANSSGLQGNGVGITLLLNAGSGSFTITSTSTTPIPNAVAAGDFNGDGYTDFAVVNSDSTLAIWINNGAGFDTAVDAGSFPFSVAMTYSTTSVATSIAVGDINGDGLPDIVVGSPTGSFVGVFLAQCP